MTFTPPLEPGESLRHDLEVQQLGRRPLRLVLTDRAAYWPTAASRTVRAPVGQIRRVEVVEARHLVGPILAGLLLAVFLLLFLFVTTGSLIPLLCVAAIFLRAVFEKPRLTITLQADAAHFSWTEPSDATSDRAHDARAAGAALLTWAVEFGIPVHDRRKR
jgi:hypothetical protein